MDASSAKRLVRGLIDAEFSSGYPLLRRIPSPRTWSALVYVENLGESDRDVLFDVLAERGCTWLRTDLDMTRYTEEQQALVRHPAYQRFVNEHPAAPCGKYADPRFMRECLIFRRLAEAEGMSVGPFDFGPLSIESVERVEPPVTAKAPEIRKAVKEAFSTRFRMKPVNAGSGVWNYPGEFEGRPFTLTLYWGSYMKMRYGITPGQLPTHKAFHGINGVAYEGMLGFGIGHWDFICQHNLAATVELLGEIIEKLVRLPAPVRG
jgi:hypothetical protein